MRKVANEADLVRVRALGLSVARSQFAQPLGNVSINDHELYDCIRSIYVVNGADVTFNFSRCYLFRYEGGVIISHFRFKLRWRVALYNTAIATVY